MTTEPLILRVAKYIPDRMYGFLQDEQGNEVFFHLRVFRPTPEGLKSSILRPGQELETPPPPVLGELVQVEMDTESDRPRASKVIRLTLPTLAYGKVDAFDAARGYGFIHGNDAEQTSYHLHRCEVLEGRMPLPGQKVEFFVGERQGKPRACHIKIY